jgi:TPR repeat protein
MDLLSRIASWLAENEATISAMVGHDATRAAALFRQACNEGNAGRRTNLGFAYDRGDGVPRDRGHAVEFLRKGCDMGFPAACKHLEQRIP